MSFIEKFWEDFGFLSVIIVIFSFLLLYVLLDIIFGKYGVDKYGIVIDKHYKPELNITGYGNSFDGKGGAVIVTQHENEKFLIILRTEDGKITTEDSGPEIYYKKEIGDKIIYKELKGKFSSIIYMNKIVN